LIGSEIDGRYRILAKLDEGGMGEVYLAEHMHLGRHEALKFLHAALAGDPELAARFRREARVMNRLSHPNIVAVYDFGRADGRFYLAIEYAAGKTLADTLALEGALPMGRVIRILAQLADAVDHAHRRAVVHRDLTPRNLILAKHRGQPDVVKVLDFGLAQLATSDEVTTSAPSSGRLHGTVGYMAPELFAGGDASPASDIYALGCIGWEMLTGRPPFVGRAADVIEAHLRAAAPSPSAHRIVGPVPQGLEQLILRCLEKDPARRLASAGALAQRLLGALGDRAPDARRGARGRADDDGTIPPYGTAPDTLLDDGRTPTLLLPLGDALGRYRVALRELAEMLLDHGTEDVRLGVALAQLGRLELELDRRTAEMDDLEEELTALEQRAREREAMIRFAMADLRFIRDQSIARNVPVGREIEDQLAGLGGELTRMLAGRDQAIEGLTERQLDLAARVASVEDALLTHCRKLEPIADAAAAAVTSPMVAEARERVEEARLVVELATGPGR
jgi:hypothetical protein